MKIHALAPLSLAPLGLRLAVLSSSLVPPIAVQAQLEETHLPPALAAGTVEFGGFDHHLVVEELERNGISRAALERALRGGYRDEDKQNENGKTTKKGARKTNKGASKTNKGKTETCDPEGVVLADYPQWQDERGYWLGDYDLYRSDGEAFVSPSWPFSYKAYKGFITGNVDGNSYRQRNVFVYPPLASEKCTSYSNETLDMFNGKCGENGSTKLFQADQSATTCSTNPAYGGTIEGPYERIYETKTQLVGQDDAVLYQVILPAEAIPAGVFGNTVPLPVVDCTLQSQLTTLTRDLSGQVFRTRTAQGFECFNSAKFSQSTSVSYYRERKVNETVFYEALQSTLAEFNVTMGDTCTMKSGSTGGTLPTGYTPGIDGCKDHLSQSFDLPF